MSVNIIYQDNTDIVHPQANPAYSTINDTHIYEELPDSINMKETGNIKEGMLNLICMYKYGMCPCVCPLQDYKINSYYNY